MHAFSLLNTPVKPGEAAGEGHERSGGSSTGILSRTEPTRFLSRHATFALTSGWLSRPTTPSVSLFHL